MIAVIGCITLFIAATIAITATDIKRVLAYSTVSQLGYMMLALGVGGWVAGMFHLITHAFFKSLLFMCSGSVIHACHTNEMPQMGGLRKKMPWTAYTMLVGCLAIMGAGIPFSIGLSGHYSKDAILAQALSFRGSNPQCGPVVFRGCRRRRDHGVLHVPLVVHDLRRRAARSSHLRSRPRIAQGDVLPAGGAGRVCRDRRLEHGRLDLRAADGPPRHSNAAGAGPAGRHPRRQPRRADADGRLSQRARRPSRRSTTCRPTWTATARR